MSFKGDTSVVPSVTLEVGDFEAFLKQGKDRKAHPDLSDVDILVLIAQRNTFESPFKRKVTVEFIYMEFDTMLTSASLDPPLDLGLSEWKLEDKYSPKDDKEAANDDADKILQNACPKLTKTHQWGSIPSRRLSGNATSSLSGPTNE